MKNEATGKLLLRLMVGWVFLSEGIQKFLYPNALGVGRFIKIGVPWPHVLAPLAGATEIVCGALLLLGLLGRLATLPLFVVILGAIVTTKIPMLTRQGFWSTMHEARTDFCMLLGLLAILCLGVGEYALGARRACHSE